ncbi:MAG: hypothetical protein AAB290_01595 [Candidatus Eisenbacteria bacterium]
MSACRAALAALLLAAALGTPLASGATPPAADVSRLAFRHVGGGSDPGGVLAQRVIDRLWGPSDDSIYVELDLPGWKSEPLAASLSAVLPGAGQIYTGEGSGWVYAAVEAAGWGGWWWYRHDARRLRDDAAGVAGPPDDPASGWSFERWATATESDPAEIAALYAADREAFYNSIASDPRYLSGWENGDARAQFSSVRIRADLRLTRSRLYSTGLWLNHLIAAVDALRAARFHNLPLSRSVGLKLDGRMERRGPAVAVALERKF